MSAISYKCPNCGGDLRFDPDTQQYKCEFCISTFSQDELLKGNPETADGNMEGQKAKEQQKEGGAAVVYQCPSCGAEIITDETTAATFCYYCHNPVVLQGRVAGEYLPDRVIPFKISREKAETAFLDYVKKKKFIPTAFFCKQQIEKLTGVYFPYWICEEELQGELEAAATNVRIWRVGDLEYTETKFYEVERAGNIRLDELTRNALKKANRKLVEGVQPFPMDQCVDFSMGYLSGFQAEKRDLERSDLEAEVQQEVEGYAKDLLRDTISGYATVTTKRADFRTQKQRWDYVLLPVWTLTYRGKDGKVYYYTMNGATGNVCGELPVAYEKIGILFAAVAVPLFLLCLIGGYFL